MEKQNPVKKVNLICAKGAIEDVYATLILGNGAVMEGIESASTSISSAVPEIASRPGSIPVLGE